MKRKTVVTLATALMASAALAACGTKGGQEVFQDDVIATESVGGGKN